MSLPVAAVTGAAGFIGAHLVERLRTSGFAVRALDVRPPAAALRRPDVTWLESDLREPGVLATLVAGADTVFHLASVHLEVHRSESEFVEVNVEAARALVRTCRDAGVRRLVHTSSVGVYGHVSDAPAAEDAPKHPRTPYERTKLEGERAVLSEAEAGGPDTVVLRPAWVYGPGCPRTEKLCRALRKRRFFFVGSGRNLRHPLFIDELMDAYLLAARAEGAALGRPFVIAGPRAMPLEEMVGTFARVVGAPVPRLHLPRAVGVLLALGAELSFRVVGREPPFSRRSLAFFENDNAFDTGAAERDLGFRPQVDLEEGLRRTLRVVEAGRGDGAPVPVGTLPVDVSAGAPAGGA